MDTTQINRELIISSDVSEVNIVLLEDKQLVEFHKEQKNNSISVGDVYLGRVKKILPGLNSAFIDIGSRKDAFLHYLDLGPQLMSLKKFTKLAEDGNIAQLNMETFELEKDIEKTGKISDFISVGDRIPVQIAKEPINTKGPRITADISFAGRYIVLVPFSNRVSVSQKIKSSEERRRLKVLIQSIKPNNFGVIIRTVAEDSFSIVEHLVVQNTVVFCSIKQKTTVIAHFHTENTFVRPYGTFVFHRPAGMIVGNKISVIPCRLYKFIYVFNAVFSFL